MHKNENKNYYLVRSSFNFYEIKGFLEQLPTIFLLSKTILSEIKLFCEGSIPGLTWRTTGKHEIVIKKEKHLYSIYIGDETSFSFYPTIYNCLYALNMLC